MANVKKIFVLVLSVICLACCIFALTGCGDKGDTGEQGIQGETGLGIKNAVIDANGDLIITFDDDTFVNAGNVVNKYDKLNEDNKITFNTLTVMDDTFYGKVSNDTEVFDFTKEVNLLGNAGYTVYTDIQGQNSIPTKAVNLNVGDNTFYILESCGNDSNFYTVTIRRRTIYDDIIAKIIETDAPIYMLNTKGKLVAAEYSEIEFDSTFKPDRYYSKESFFYRVIDKRGVAISAGYQINTIYQENDYLTIAIPDYISNFHVETWSGSVWTTPTWVFEKSDNIIDGYTCYRVPDRYEVLSGIVIRIVIDN